MLKAVRLDDEKHKDIIDFITNYKDEKGKTNESAAIRYLIINGFKTVNPNFTPLEKEIIDVNKLKRELLQEIENNSPNINEIKSQIREELIREMNTQRDQNIMAILDKLNNLQNNIQPTYVQPIPQQIIPQPIAQPIQQKSIKEETKQIINQVEEKISMPNKKIEIPIDTNPLLANILANANR